MTHQVIIGASSGVGAAILKRFIERGDKVWVTYNEHPIESGANVFVQKYDVLNDPFSRDFFPDQIDGIVYCPGSINLKPFQRLSSEELILDYRLNVLGAVEVIKQLLPQLKRSDSAAITLFSSVAVQKGFPFHLQVGLSKGAIEGAVRSLSSELAPTIRVNALAPSLTMTGLSERMLNSEEKIKANAERHLLKRVGEPKDHAAMVALLHSKEGSWITGQIIHIDGGISIS